MSRTAKAKQEIKCNERLSFIFNPASTIHLQYVRLCTSSSPPYEIKLKNPKHS